MSGPKKYPKSIADRLSAHDRKVIEVHEEWHRKHFALVQKLGRPIGMPDLDAKIDEAIKKQEEAQRRRD